MFCKKVHWPRVHAEYRLHLQASNLKLASPYEEKNSSGTKKERKKKKEQKRKELKVCIL